MKLLEIAQKFTWIVLSTIFSVLINFFKKSSWIYKNRKSQFKITLIIAWFVLNTVFVFEFFEKFSWVYKDAKPKLNNQNIEKKYKKCGKTIFIDKD